MVFSLLKHALVWVLSHRGSASLGAAFPHRSLHSLEPGWQEAKAAFLFSASAIPHLVQQWSRVLPNLVFYSCRSPSCWT